MKSPGFRSASLGDEADLRFPQALARFSSFFPPFLTFPELYLCLLPERSVKEEKMANINVKPGKAELRRKLFAIGVESLERDGWKVERVPGEGKSSVRRITKGGESLLITIRTTQDTWIAFPRKGQKWGTLSDVDAVLAVSVDDREEPRFAQVHMIDGDEMRERFDRNYAARKAAGHSQPSGYGTWVSLYHQEAQDPANRVGAGAGIKNPPIARVSLTNGQATMAVPAARPPRLDAGQPLTINQAKEGLALTFGVEPSSVKITIEA
jgi:hypothetical protein